MYIRDMPAYIPLLKYVGFTPIYPKRGRFVYEKDGKRSLISIEEAKRYCERNTALQFGYNFGKLLKYTLCDFFKHDYDEDTVAYLKKSMSEMTTKKFYCSVFVHIAQRTNQS